MLSRIRLIIAFIILIVAGCQGSTGQVVPSSTPQILRLDITPASDWMLPAINECQAELEGVNLTIREIFTRSLDQTGADMLILSGEPDLTNSYAVEIEKTSLVFIINPANSINAASTKMLKEIFSGQVSLWSEVDASLPVEPIHVWIPPSGDELTNALISTLMDGQLAARTANIAPDPKAMLTSVSADKFSIGVLPQAILSQSVKVLDSQLEISLPIIAVVTSKPEGILREFLLCLQTSQQP
jgi:hypothetical protein